MPSRICLLPIWLARISAARWLLLWLGLVGMGTAQGAPGIQNQPQSQSALVGGSVILSVIATNAGSYNFDLSGKGSSTNLVYTGQTAGQLTNRFNFYGVGDRMTIYYASSQICDTGQVSGSGTFSVGYGPGSDPFVTVIMNEGNNYTPSTWEYHLSMVSPIYYQWRFNGTNLAGFTNAACSLTNLASSNAGNYQVVVTDSSGSVTSAVATLTVLIPPAITQPPVGMTVAAGVSSNLTVAAVGTAPLSYQWQHNGTNLTGATAATYTFTNAQGANAGNYAVVVTNVAGSVTSATALVKVLISPNLVNITGSSTNFAFSYATMVGLTYVVQYKANLDSLTWVQLATNTGTGNLTNFFTTTTGISRGYYRVLVR